MAQISCVKRLMKEYDIFCKQPVPQVVAHPLPNDILEWHYVLEGSEGTPFAGGHYYGIIRFPPDYPFKPPSFSMITPNGRFAPHKRICLSMSDFHPETWNPVWYISSMLTGLLSFMMDKDIATGCIKTSDDEKRLLAKVSLAYNCESKNCPYFKKLFPEYVAKYKEKQVLELSNSEQDKPRAQPSAPMPANTERPSILEGEDKGRIVPEGGDRRQDKVPLWLPLLSVSVFGAVMAFPLFHM